MSSTGFDHLRELLGWAQEADRDKIAKAGLTEEFDSLRRAVGRGRLEATQIAALRSLFPLLESTAPDVYSTSIHELEELVGVDDGDRLLSLANRFAINSGIAADVTVSQEDPEKSKPIIPSVTDPRALVLPTVTTKSQHKLFIGGFNGATKEVSLISPVRDADGRSRLLIQMMNAETGEKNALVEWKNPFFQDGDTTFFANSRFEEASIYAVTFDPTTGKAAKVERYPSYSAAGFVAPIKRSILVTPVQRDKSPTSYTARVFTQDKEYVEVRIFENEKGDVERVMYKDFARGELQKGADRLFEQEYYLMPDHGLKIAFKKIPIGVGRAAYRIFIYHEMEDETKNMGRTLTPQTPVVLDATNTNWLVDVATQTQRLTEALQSGAMNPQGLQTELYRIRDTEGMRVASEVILSLYWQEATQMHVVNALKLESTEHLPLPPDTRIFPGSRDLVSKLLTYFSYATVRGYVSRQLMDAARELFPDIPGRYIEGLWLYATNPTAAEERFLQRGAGTPVELTEGYPVGKYRRILDESYTPLADTKAARTEQREHIQSFLKRDFLNAGFQQYLNYQFNLADNFDLLLLESGGLYYKNNLIRVISVSEDGSYLKALVDSTQKIIDIPRADAQLRRDPNLSPLTVLQLAREVLMAPHHEDDPFLFTYRDPLKARQVATGGSFANGNMLIRLPDETYRVPTAVEVKRSLEGLLELPQNYLKEIIPNGGIDATQVSFQKRDPVPYDLAAMNFGLSDIELDKYPPLKMIPYDVTVGDFKMEVFLPQPSAKMTKELRERGYYIATEEDLPKIVKYYLSVTTQGFCPTRANIYMVPGLITRKDDESGQDKKAAGSDPKATSKPCHHDGEPGVRAMTQNDSGILGFYTWKSEDLVISSEVVGPENSFERWAAIRLFNTARHEIAHSIKRGNPWITSLVYRAMALDGFTMDYGSTHLEEYFAVLAQHFFDHPIHRQRFPNGYRLLYTLIKLKEEGVSWEGPNHNIRDADPTNLLGRERDIDGTFGALRTLALGTSPFAGIRLAKLKSSNDNGSGGSGGAGGGAVATVIATEKSTGTDGVLQARAFSLMMVAPMTSGLAMYHSSGTTVDEAPVVGNDLPTLPITMPEMNGMSSGAMSFGMVGMPMLGLHVV